MKQLVPIGSPAFPALACMLAIVAVLQFSTLDRPAYRRAHEHIYWDQASVLAQLGLIDAARLPVCGTDAARKALDASLPANALIRRAALM